METGKKLLFIIIILFLAGCGAPKSAGQHPPEAIEGVLDLQDWDFEKDGSINLIGEWSFFWEQLLTPGQIAKQNQAQFVYVPNSWTEHANDGNQLPSDGYATYALTIYLPENDLAYGLYK